MEMQSTPPGGIRERRGTRPSACLLVFLILFLSPVSAWGGEKEEDELRLKDAAAVFLEIVRSGDVPSVVQGKADCILVLPKITQKTPDRLVALPNGQVGIVVGQSESRGVMSCRAGEDFNGAWSAPAMYTIDGMSGASSGTGAVLFVMGKHGVEAVLEGETKMGSEATAAPGPDPAAIASGSLGVSDILIYARANGRTAGVSLYGATLRQDSKANQRLYEKEVNARNIVSESAVETPVSGQPLIALLNKRIPTHSE